MLAAMRKAAGRESARRSCGMKWVSRAADLTLIASAGLALVLSTTCVGNLELFLLAGLSGLSLAVWLDEPADGRGYRRVFRFLACIWVGTLAVLGNALPLSATPGC
jgi:hypothetical protein